MAPPSESGASLQKISREHHIGSGPGGAVLVAGGKYTTHRTMAEEIVDYAVDQNAELKSREKRRFSTEAPVNPRATHEALARAKDHPKAGALHSELWERYGAEAIELLQIEQEFPPTMDSPEGFPKIEAQLRFCIRLGMVVHLEDFYFRRIPLFAARADHGLPWLDRLVEVWGEELEKTPEQKSAEKQVLVAEITAREGWRRFYRTSSVADHGTSKVARV